jgi:hypothetical protein
MSHISSGHPLQGLVGEAIREMESTTTRNVAIPGVLVFDPSAEPGSRPNYTDAGRIVGSRYSSTSANWPPTQLFKKQRVSTALASIPRCELQMYF